jgi:hypothetical protein
MFNVISCGTPTGLAISSDAPAGERLRIVQSRPQAPPYGPLGGVSYPDPEASVTMLHTSPLLLATLVVAAIFASMVLVVKVAIWRSWTAMLKHPGPEPMQHAIGVFLSVLILCCRSSSSPLDNRCIQLLTACQSR